MDASRSDHSTAGDAESSQPRHRVALVLSVMVLSHVFTGTVYRASAQDIVPRILPRILLGEETTDYESVGIVGSLQRGGFCSGTLIGPNHVLTAAHCAETIEDEFSGTFELDGEVYLSVEIFIHPDYNSRTLENDLAILRLSETVEDVVPSPIFRDTPLVGDILFIVGFGGTGTAEGGSDGTFGTKRVGTTTIDEVTETLVNWTFDDASETNTAAGDSGGPGYIDIEGDLFVASVTSGGTNADSSLGDFAFNTRVDAFADWIDLVVATTPADPDPADPDPDPSDPEPPLSDGDDCPADGGESDYRPFPLLQALIEWLTALLDELLAQFDPTPSEPSDPVAPDQPEVEQPEVEQPEAEQPEAGQPESPVDPETPDDTDATGEPSDPADPPSMDAPTVDDLPSVQPSSRTRDRSRFSRRSRARR